MKKIINVTILFLTIISKCAFAQTTENETPPCSNSIIRTDPKEIDFPLVNPQKNKECLKKKFTQI